MNVYFLRSLGQKVDSDVFKLPTKDTRLRTMGKSAEENAGVWQASNTMFEKPFRFLSLRAIN